MPEIYKQSVFILLLTQWKYFQEIWFAFLLITEILTFSGLKDDRYKVF